MTNTNTTTATIEELVMRSLITELKFMNLKIDVLENEIDQRKKEMVDLENEIDEKLDK